MLLSAGAPSPSLSSSLQSLVDSLGIGGRMGWAVDWGGGSVVFSRLGQRRPSFVLWGPLGRCARQ